MTEAEKPFSRQQLAQQYIPDFLEESDEHLRSSAKNLLSLEKAILQPDDGEYEISGLIDDLLRSFHTLKGLTGIVGLRPAAEISHDIESILDNVRSGRSEITNGMIDSMVRGTQTLDKVISALRDEDKPLPDISPMLEELAVHLPETKETSSEMAQNEKADGEGAAIANETQSISQSFAELPKDIVSNMDDKDWQLVRTAIDTGKSLTLGIFTPSEDKTGQGITVNSIREELQEATHLIKVIPLLTDGEVRFAFLVSVDHEIDPGIFPSLVWTPIAVSQSASGRSDRSSFGDSEVSRTTSSLRVDIKRLDELMHLVGDLIVSRSRLIDVLPQLSGAPQAALETLEQTSSGIERQLRSLREAVMHVRLVPLSEVFDRMPLAVRDLARDSGHEVQLEMRGEETEIDKVLVERLHDPLLHLVRNAITHGIETPTERIAVDKQPEGVLRLSGRPEGDHIIVSISDDGRGIDKEKIAAKAQKLGLIGAQKNGQSLTNEDALDLMCRSGFTTKKGVDLGSGRGVGMDVVRRMVDAVGGSMSMQTTLGEGTCFDLRLPLTMTIIDALIIRLGDERYAVPRGDVHEVIEINLQDVVRTQQGELLPFRDAALPLLRLHNLFGHNADKISPRLHGLVSGDNGSSFAIVIDRVIGIREIVVHTISDELIAQPGITGATDLGDGEAVLILDLHGLRRFAREKFNNGGSA